MCRYIKRGLALFLFKIIAAVAAAVVAAAAVTTNIVCHHRRRQRALQTIYTQYTIHLYIYYIIHVCIAFGVLILGIIIILACHTQIFLICGKN